jgi:hypothetical protein
VRRRLSRLQPGHVPASVRAWVIACWLMSVGLVAVLFIPGITDVVSVQGEGVIATFSASLKFRIAMLVAIAVLCGAAVVWILLRTRVDRDRTRWEGLLREAVLVPIALFPALALAADHAWLRALAALIAGLAGFVFAHLPVVRRGALGVVAVIGLVAALPWLSLVAYQATAAGARTDSWLWVALFGAAAAFAAFGAYYGVARAAESRSKQLLFLYRADLRPALVIAIVAACVVIVVLRLTVARELFPVPDPQLWTPFDRPLVSWAIAAVVAGIIVVVAIRASVAPLTRFGERRVVAILAGLGNLELIGSLLVILIGMIVAILTAAVFLPTAWMVFVPLAKFIGVVILALIVLLPAFRGTAARWIGLSAAIFLAASTLNTALITGGVRLPSALDAFPATPVQVLLLMLLAAVALAVWNLVRPDRRVNPSLVVRLAVVPLIAVHAGWLLPAAWSELGRVVVVIAALAALFWLMPPVAADRTRHGYAVLSASLAQLLVLAVFVLAIPSLFADGALTVLGLLWLSVPIIAALTIDTEPPRVEAASR